MNSSDSSVVLIWVLHLAEGSGLGFRHLLSDVFDDQQLLLKRHRA